MNVPKEFKSFLDLVCVENCPPASCPSPKYQRKFSHWFPCVSGEAQVPQIWTLSLTFHYVAFNFWFQSIGQSNLVREYCLGKLLNLHFCQPRMVMSKGSSLCRVPRVCEQGQSSRFPHRQRGRLGGPVIASCCGKHCAGRHRWSDVQVGTGRYVLKIIGLV